MTDEYSIYLSSDAWAATRSRVLDLAGGKCEACGYGFNIEIHHLTYARIFHEDDKDLMALCPNHHRLIEELIRKKQVSRNGDTRHLALKTLELLGHRSKGTKEIRNPIQQMLLEDPEFTRLLPLGRKPFKKAVRKLFMDLPGKSRWTINAMILHDHQ